VPDSDPSFAELVPDERVLRALTDVGYETPSPIQARTIPLLLAGRDVVGLAQTGTGKTAAFAVPILCGIDPDRRTTQALILTPTRELALQVSEAFTRYAAHLPGVQVLPVYGGSGYGPQLAGLRRGAQIVVGTPGRVIDHLNKGSLDLSGLDHLVLDEADEMLRMGFAEDVDTILAETPEYKQVALFSATMPKAIKAIAKRHLHDPAEVHISSATMTLDTITQQWLLVPHHAKLDVLTRLLEVSSGDAMIIFVRTKQATEELAERLRARGFAAQAINGDLAQPQRERTIAQLRDGTLDLLVATDVAARGLDVDRISHVVNYDIPHDVDSYVHRIGRTGRAGRSGTAWLFVTPREQRLLAAIKKHTRSDVEQISVPSVDDVNAHRQGKFAESITVALDNPAHDQFRELIGQYAADHDADPIDIAAALAVQAYPDPDFFRTPDAEPAREHRTPRVEHVAGAVTYRLATGKRNGVTPGAVVGALCNEGGLHRSDFGHIKIGAEHTTVELLNPLANDVLQRLQRTMVGGRPIRITEDHGPSRGDRRDRPDTRGPRAADDTKPFKNKGKRAGDRKPRHGRHGSD